MDKIRQLENRIKKLENWKQQKIVQQISFPLDAQSLNILKKYFMHITTIIEYDAGAGANHFVHFLGKQGSEQVPRSSYVPGTQGNPIYFQIEPISLVSYTVDISTDYLTTTQFSGNVKFFDDTEITLVTEGTAPSPLDGVLGTPYYVRDSDGYTFKLALELTKTAGAFTIGHSYEIVSVGSTDFTLIGSADNNVGTIFTATGAGTGTGTAKGTAINITDNGSGRQFITQ